MQATAAPGAPAHTPPGTAHLLMQEPMGRLPLLRVGGLLWETQRAWWEGEIDSLVQLGLVTINVPRS